MTRILVSALAAVVIHGAALYFLPFANLVPGTVSPKDHGIAIQIVHPSPEPAPDAGLSPAPDMLPEPRPREQPPPAQKQLPEKKQPPEGHQPPEKQQPPEPVAHPPEPDEPDGKNPEPDVAEPDVPDFVDSDPETLDMPFSDTMDLPSRKILDPYPSETGTAQRSPGSMTAPTDETAVTHNLDDRDSPAPDPSPARKESVPLYKKNPSPRYPGNARRRGHAGTVQLMVYVTEKGEAGQVRVFESSGYASLDRAAEKAVADWRFEPGTSDGVPTGMWVKIPITFELKN